MHLEVSLFTFFSVFGLRTNAFQMLHSFPSKYTTTTGGDMLHTLLAVEDRLIALLGWPGWALRVIATLQLCVGVTSLLQALFIGNCADHNEKKDHKRVTSEFRWFQVQYLGVYLTIMVADWLQGTNMYTLYSVSKEYCTVSPPKSPTCLYYFSCHATHSPTE